MQSEQIEIKRDETAWEIELKASIPASAMEIYREESLKELQKTAKLDGFRPGKVPLERLIAIYGEAQLLRLAAERAIQTELPEILAKENLLIVEAPRVQTDTPEPGKPLAFTARASLPPEVKLPEWKKIAQKHSAKKESVTVSDDEYTEAQTHIRRERARIEKVEKGEDQQKAFEASKALPEADLPPLDEEFAKSLGYESEAKFLESLKTNILSEKEAQKKQQLRNAILEDIVKEASIHYPVVMREYELDDMETRIKDDLARMGASYEQYLIEVKKTREELRKEWQEAADKRAKTRLILSEIARQEKIVADAETIEAELKHAKEHYKEVDENNLRSGIAHAMRNEKVLKLLEMQ